MKLIIIFAISLLLISCGNSPLVKQLEGSDSIAVFFKNPGNGALNNVVGSSKSSAIKTLTNFVDSKEIGQLKCGYDGNIRFYKKGILAADILFNYTTDGCKHFYYQVNDKFETTSMSFEASDFLQSLALSNK